MQRRGLARFILCFAIGMGFFFLPFTFMGKLTVPFDAAVSLITKNFPGTVELYCLALILAGGAFSAASRLGDRRLAPFRSGMVFTLLRAAGAVLAVLMAARAGPAILVGPEVRDLMWTILIPSVAVIVPLGAAVVNLLTRTGGLDFIGVLATPVMRPLYGLPGRAALDIMTSWVGSYSVGLYITKSVFAMGGYTKRQAFIIATCFSTVSIGFVGVVASTLDLLHLFPLIFLGYFVAVFGTAALLVRVYPTSRISQDTVAPAMADDPPRGRLFRTAVERAVLRAAESEPVLRILGRGLRDGLLLASLILGTILSVGSAALVLAHTTILFDLAGLPLRPLYEFLSIPDASKAATATLIEIAEMYLPAVLVAHSPAFTKFFIAVLSTSQLIFFSSVAPMILEMFRDIPVRVTHLLILFVERTVILVPLVYLYTLLVSALGFLG